MSIRPIDFSGMIQNSQELGNVRSQQEHRPVIEQNVITETSQQEVELSATRVQEQEDSAESQMDADGGNGSGYQGNRRRSRSRQKKEKVSDGTVTVKTGHPSFDARI